MATVIKGTSQIKHLNQLSPQGRTNLPRRQTDLDPLHGGPQPLLQLGQLAAQVGVVSHQLLVHLGQLVEVVLQERDLLLLGQRAAHVVRLLPQRRLGARRGRGLGRGDVAVARIDMTAVAMNWR